MLKPPAILAMSMPPAMPREDIIPIAASPKSLAFSVSFRIPNELNITMGMEIYTGCCFKSRPMATLPKVTWANPSPIKEKRLNTRSTPNKEQTKAINEPVIKALRMN
jgi:hypothetical protein